MQEDKKQTEPIDTQQELKSKDEHIDQDFPGYPHYPAKEDIMNPKNHTERVEANVENLSKESLKNKPSESKKKPNGITNNEDDLGIVTGTDGDINKDDLISLHALDKGMPEGENVTSVGSGGAFEATEDTLTDIDDKDLADEMLRSGDDLDISGGDLDDSDENIGEEDEENNYYSLGGDEKNNLEDDATAQGY